MLVRYVANKSSSDGTSRVSVGGKSLTLGGSPVDLTDDEVARVSGRIVIEPVEAAEETAPPVVDVGEDTPSDPPPEPAQFGAVPPQQSPATPGASVSTPNTSTPPSGS